MIKKILAIETSCDDTSVAIVSHTGEVVSLVSASQDFEHEPYGGIVPEIASRNHTIALIPLINKALSEAKMEMSELEGVAVTSRPGLIGALIVGIMTAKSIAHALKIPIIGVNHLEAHLLAPFLKDKQYSPPSDLAYPYVGLAISGGHTSLYYIRDFGSYQVLGTTKDDAAGEAFDKFAKMLGLGFPGGVKLDQTAKGGNPKAYDFPRSMLHDQSLDMSFSGLKASGQRKIEELGEQKVKENLSDLCASYQQAIVDVLIAKLEKAANKYNCKTVIITGGVSANSRLRELSTAWAQKNNFKLVIPPIRYCTDNAAMVGYVGINYLNKGITSDMSLGPSPQLLPTDFQ